jgi:hypothetical protein
MFDLNVRNISCNIDEFEASSVLEWDEVCIHFKNKFCINTFNAKNWKDLFNK